MKFTGLLSALTVASVSANDMIKQLIEQSHHRLEATGFYHQDEKPPSVLGQPQDCVDNAVVIDGEVFDCSNVDFISFLSLADLEIETLPHPFGFRSADIWGWKSPVTDREITLLSLDNGVAAVDTTDPLFPCILAKMPTGRDVDIWADVKVYENVMYHVKDKRGGDVDATRNIGIEVYDLLAIDQLDCKVPGFEIPYLEPDFVFAEHGRSHNLVVNPESGLLYSVGTEQCAGGFMIIDVATNPLEPTLIGCADADGYTHDGQCLVYDGPDPDHQGKEICLGFNEDTLTIWDLSDLNNPVLLSKLLYPNQAYSHQGWVNDDLTKVLLDDELDELCNSDAPPSFCDFLVTGELLGIKTTSTVVIDISDLDNPVYDGAFIHEDLSIDHNLYVWGTVHRKGWGGNPPLEFYPDPNFAYLNNYLAGLRILDISTGNVEEFTEVGYFDISPEITAVEFAGAWSGYMHPSGVYAISSIERGLFLLQPRMAFTPDFPPPPQATAAPTSDDGGVDVDDDLLAVLALILVVIAFLLMLVALSLLCSGSTSAARKAAYEVKGEELKAGPIV